MNIRVISADRLTPEHVQAWSQLQRADPALDSPYFRPEFTQIVAAVRNDVEVAVLEEGGEPVGYFPFQRGRGNVARPVCARMSDFQGIIMRKGVAWDPPQLLRGCGLSAWHFDHLIAAQEPFRPYHWSVHPSPYMDLSQGWEHYRSEQLARHKVSFQQALRKQRHAARKAGPLRLEVQSKSPAVFRDLLEWKSDQYRRSAGTDVFAFGWTVALLERLLAADDEAFSGLMSALYLDDVLAAVLLCMRSYHVVHSWFCAYRPDFARLSPGLVLWMEVAQAYPALGIRRIDLGQGPEEYKRHLMSGATDVAEGSVDLRPVAAVARRNWYRAYQWTRRSPLRGPLLAPARFLRRWVTSRGFRQ